MSMVYIRRYCSVTMVSIYITEMPIVIGDDHSLVFLTMINQSPALLYHYFSLSKLKMEEETSNSSCSTDCAR